MIYMLTVERGKNSAYKCYSSVVLKKSNINEMFDFLFCMLK